MAAARSGRDELQGPLCVSNRPPKDGRSPGTRAAFGGAVGGAVRRRIFALHAGMESRIQANLQPLPSQPVPLSRTACAQRRCA